MVKFIRIGIVGILLLFGIVSSLGSSYSYSNKGIYYDNVKYSDNVDFYGVNGTDLKFNGNLSNVGDSYFLTFDVVNDSDADMIITDYLLNEEDPYITYQLTYIDGKKVKEGDILEKGKIKTLHYVVKYENPVLEDNYEVDSSFQIQYDQKI